MDANELAQAEQKWDVREPERHIDLKERWDVMAAEWEEKLRDQGLKRLQYEKRMAATMDWLKSFGLLEEDCDVADIGCGPGRFVAEFAKSCRYVLGVDISSRMVEYGRSYAAELGLSNAEFYAGNFPELDVTTLGWQNRFDLVFSSITPAIRGKSGLDNLIAMSRAWCYNSCFVYSSNKLHDRILLQLFGLPPRREKTNHSCWFKQLFDLLWLRGYHPYVHYYKDHREEKCMADQETAEEFARLLLGEEKVTLINTAQILKFLKQNVDANGLVPNNNDCWYGWLLWDVRDRIER